MKTDPSLASQIDDLLGPAPDNVPPVKHHSKVVSEEPLPPVYEIMGRKRLEAATSDSAQAKIMELMKDKWWRMNNLYLILDERGIIFQFKMRHEQESFFRTRHDKNFVPKARKLGMSTLIVLDYLDRCLFTSNYRCGVIDLKQDDAQSKLAIARFAYDHGPIDHPDPGIRFMWKQVIHKLNPLINPSLGKLEWKNGSIYTAGTSYTGKTPLALHISEFGPIASQFPKVAENIVRGSMNAVPMGGVTDVETTMEGGRIGECYHIFEQAKIATKLDDLSELDWRMHFFSWLGHPSYRLHKRAPTKQATLDYFNKIKQSHGRWIEEKFGWVGGEVPADRQAWWEKKRTDLRDLIWQQFPTVIDECDMAAVIGQIYPEMAQVRNERRVLAFNPEPHLPFFVSADLGSSKNTALWLHQPAGKNHNVIDCAFGETADPLKPLGAAWVANKFRQWEETYGFIAQLVVPHDAHTTDKGGGLTYVETLVKCGVPRQKITVVPRTPDVWVGIDATRRALPNCWFHSRCDEVVINHEGIKYPSGVARLENYRVKVTPETGEQRNPFKDGVCDHAADGFRTYWEGDEQSLVRTHLRVTTDGDGKQMSTAAKVKVVMQKP